MAHKQRTAKYSLPPTVINSIARLLDVGGAFRGTDIPKDTIEALYEDWALAGADLTAAMEYYADELLAQQRITAEEHDQLISEAEARLLDEAEAV